MLGFSIDLRMGNEPGRPTEARQSALRGLEVATHCPREHQYKQIPAEIGRKSSRRSAALKFLIFF
jgi:hypothetical protein